MTRKELNTNQISPKAYMGKKYKHQANIREIITKRLLIARGELLFSTDILIK